MTVVNALIGIAVLVYVIVNQLRPRSIGVKRVRIAGVLALVGVLQMRSFATVHALPALGWTLLLVGLAIGAAVGVWRAYTMTIWTENGQAMMRGTWFTAGLWLVGIAAHVGIDLLTRVLAPTAEAAGSASILLFIAVSLGAQALTVLQRARVEQPSAVPAAR